MDESEELNSLDIFFSDATINEASCHKNIVFKFMNEEIPLKEWMLESEFGISNGLEESFGIMQFWQTGEAILKEYQSGFMDEIVPTDVIFLREYLLERGWDFLVDEELVESDRGLWDKFFSVISEDDIEEDMFYEDDENEEDAFLMEEGEEESFVREFPMKEYPKPKANKYNILEAPGFLDHAYDLEKREKTEEENKF